MCDLTLFYTSTSQAFKDFKNRFWFWQLLMLKVLAIGMLMSIATGLMVLLTIGFVLMLLSNATPVPTPSYLASLLNVLPLWISGILALVLTITTLYVFIKCTQLSAAYGATLFANPLDVAQQKTPRGFTRIENPWQILGIMIIAMVYISPSCLIPFMPLKIITILIFSIFFNIKLFYAYFILLDKQTTVLQAFKESWNLTRGHTCALLFVAIPLTLNMMPKIFIDINPQHHSLLILLALLIIYPLFTLICAHTYVNLKNSK